MSGINQNILQRIRKSKWEGKISDNLLRKAEEFCSHQSKLQDWKSKPRQMLFEAVYGVQKLKAPAEFDYNSKLGGKR